MTVIAPNTFFAHCAQTIKSKDALIAQNKWHAKVYRYSAYAHFVLGAAIILGGIAVKAFAAVYLPLTMISLPLILNKISRSHSRTLQQSNNFLKCNEKIIKISRQHTLIKQKYVWRAKIQALLPDGAQKSEKELRALRYLYAYYKYSINIYDAYTRLERGQIAKIRQLPSRQERSIACATLAKEKQLALKSKVEAAFMLAVMKNPRFTGDPKAICDTLDFDWTQPVLQCDEFLVFKDPSIHGISSSAVDWMSPDEISQHILAAMQRLAAMRR